jgi:hypothetical protein
MDRRFSITVKRIKSGPGPWLAPEFMKVVQKIPFKSVKKGGYYYKFP